MKAALPVCVLGSTLFFAVATPAHAHDFLAELRDACGDTPASQRCDETAYQAATAYRDAGATGKAIVAYRMLIAFEERTRSGSPLAAKAMFDLAESYRAIATFDLAAEWYERFAAAQPKAPQTIEALRSAALLRLGLGDEGRGVANATALIRSFGKSDPDKAAEMALLVASHRAEKERWSEARDTLLWAKNVFESGPDDLRIRAQVLLARTYARGGPVLASRASAEYGKARALWKASPITQASLEQSAPDADETLVLRRLARVLTDVGEALLAGADERRRAEVERLVVPVFAGTQAQPDVDAYVQKLAAWSVKKRAAIEAVEREYVQILDLQPVPPPRAVVGAASRVAFMWAGLVDDLKRAIPKSAGRALQSEASGISDPIKRSFAKPALVKCVELAAKYQLVDEGAQACEAWLEKNLEREHHRVDELIPAFVTPSSRSTRIDAPPLPSVVKR